MNTLSGYIFRQVWGAALALTFGLAILVLLTQSLRFLDLMIAAGAAPSAFFALLALSLPRLIEIVLPIALGVAVLVVGLKLHSDQELTVIQAMGVSPACIAKPVLAVLLLSSVFLASLSFWLTPTSVSILQAQRQMIQAQFSLSLLQPAVFNFFGDNIMVYFDRRDKEGRLVNLILHDQRDKENPYTLMAETGELISDGTSYNLSITNGRRQQRNADRGVIDQLTFARYQIELPKTIRDIAPRWKEPDERTIVELWRARQSTDINDVNNAMTLRSEFHRRLATPFIPFSVGLPILWLILMRARPRRSVLPLVAMAIVIVAVIQGGVLAAMAMADKNDYGVALLYLVTMGPAFWAMSRLAQHGESRVAAKEAFA